MIAIGVVAAVAALLGGWFYIMATVEKPAYSVVTSDGAFEIRDYPSLVVAQVTRTGDRKSAVNAGFRPLANYIFAKERTGDRIAMTAPVTQRRETIAMTAPVTQSRMSDGDGGAWTVRFIMPSNYQLETLPPPLGDDVSLSQVPAARRAAIRFSGVATDALIAEHERLLRAWLADKQLTPVEPPEYAYYNDPFTPGFLRRNEVLFNLEPTAAGGL